MKWPTRLPVIGKLMRTHAWRAYERLDAVHWARLAAAITFTSFVALFPLITVGAAIGAKLLSDEQLGKLQDKIAAQAPGLSDLLDLDSLVEHAGSVGLIAGALLLVIGINWVGALRGCLRAVWEKEQDPGNPFLLRLKDSAVLVGLGTVGLVAIGGSVFANSAAAKAGIEGGAGRALLFFTGLAIALAVDFLLLVYLLTRLPRVHPGRRAVVVAGLIGAVGFELLKWLLTGYLQGVAAKSMYGAFAVPVAVVLWINLIARLLLYCAAWTATAAGTEVQSGEAAEGESP
ncbi:YihY/virulence factor BrkB family protein [Streptomyces tailanensis]|uniref:YihY/virulence factor BrkB family protein n=1 Tax=Streptomyces tailanensis TaxID=2569858 RepID=UPI00122DD295|nr:YihY/virulence factor BrkB family protein [Streptomyces tailanensis]